MTRSQPVTMRSGAFSCQVSSDILSSQHSLNNIIHSLPLAAFMIVTQFFYTLCLIGALVGLVLVLLFFLCAGPDLSWYVLLIRSTSWLLLATGICGSLGVIVFACFGNRNNWMPEHANNWFGESAYIQRPTGSCFNYSLFLQVGPLAWPWWALLLH